MTYCFNLKFHGYGRSDPALSDVVVLDIVSSTGNNSRYGVFYFDGTEEEMDEKYIELQKHEGAFKIIGVS